MSTTGTFAVDFSAIEDRVALESNLGLPMARRTPIGYGLWFHHGLGNHPGFCELQSNLGRLYPVSSCRINSDMYKLFLLAYFRGSNTKLPLCLPVPRSVGSIAAIVE